MTFEPNSARIRPIGGISAKANGRIQARTLRLAGWRGKQVGRLVGRGKQSRQAGLAGRYRLERLMQTKVGVGVLGDDDDAKLYYG